jgi:hypothetical protein
MPGSADAGTGIGGTADKVKILSSCAIACNSITSAKIVNGTIINDDINASAGIALSKLASCPLARANHTGTQAASTISDFDTEVANNTAVTANTAKISYSCAASTAVAANTAKISYCSTASTKLATIESCATADQTGAQIKSAYEGESDTNALTDALSAEITANTAKTGISSGQASAITANTAKISYCSTASTKLATIETSATADQSNAEIKTAYEANACTNALTDTLSGNITTNNAKISYCSTASTKLATIAACANNYSHTTNANLTGPITSVGNGTAIAGGAIAAAKITGPLTNVVSHGLATSATTDTTCAANIGSGTLPVARLSGITKTQITNTERLENFIMAISDETTDLEAGTAKLTFRMPYGFTLTSITASVTTAPVGSTIIVDVNESGTTILSTKLSIDASEKTSTTAATAAVISDTVLASDAEITVDIDQIGSSTAGTGLKVTFIGYQ